MKLSIEATDKLENKDFHYELTVSKTHIAIVCGTVLARKLVILPSRLVMILRRGILRYEKEKRRIFWRN